MFNTPPVGTCLFALILAPELSKIMLPVLVPVNAGAIVIGLALFDPAFVVVKKPGSIARVLPPGCAVKERDPKYI